MKAVYDTCVYIDFLRESKHDDLFYDRGMFRFLSPVVVMELRAGAKTTVQLKALNRLFSPYTKSQRIISMNANMFLKAGEIIQNVNSEFGAISQGFSQDVLIALSASTIGATLFTSNKRDFEKISRYLNFRLKII
jgi:predicted nucleic acid-binding protein